MVVLKEYYEAVRNPETKHKALSILNIYVDKLEAEGWKYWMYEGGLVSPDGSTFFCDDRAPYVGQLSNWDLNKKAEFEAYKNKMLENGDFVEIERFEMMKG